MFLSKKKMKNQNGKRLNFQILQALEALVFYCKIQFVSDEAIGVGRKYGMKKEGQELEGMKEEREV